MAWPPTANTANTFIARGSLPATVAWGTDGIYSGVILKSIRSSRMIEEIKIENGTGLTSEQILLNDGDEAELTVVDDRAVTFPDSGNTVTILNPITASGNANSQTLQVVNNSYNAARKQEGERVILAKKYTLITPS